MNPILQRILLQTEIPDLFEKICALSTSDFNSALLEFFSLRTAASSPQKVLHSFRENRFTGPSGCDPIRMHQLELDLLTMSAGAGVINKLLSPVAPAGSCSVFGCVHQNNVLSAVRNVEVLSDPSNVLALMLADDLLKKRIDPAVCTHYAATARVVRGQHFQGSSHNAHFGLFCMVSAGRDRGSYLCEKELLLKQLRFYHRLLHTKYKGEIAVVLRRRTGYPDYEGFFDRMCAVVQEAFPDISVSIDLSHEKNRYYQGLNFKIYMRTGDTKVEIADGGFTDWIGRATGNPKNRCLISGLGLERLLFFQI